MTKLTDERKSELVSEFIYVIERYIRKQWIDGEAIDSVCINGEEVEYLKECSWWIEVLH